jgi:ubiquinol-cytochrome c reductase cytochrome c1 subunit
MSQHQYNVMIHDLVNFLAYISEPSKLERMALAKWVLLYLFIFFLVAYPLKKAFWKNVH